MDSEKVTEIEILEEIGRNDFEVLYHARDESLMQDVLVKALREEFCDDSRMVALFLEEAEHASRIQHPHVAQIHSAGEDNGRPYALQEYLYGENVQSMLESRGRLSESTVLTIAMETLEGLQAAASTGMAHGDLTAENLFMDERDGVKILNFGMAAMKVATGNSPSQLPDIPALARIMVNLLDGRSGGEIESLEERIHQLRKAFLIHENTHEVLLKMKDAGSAPNCAELLEDLYQAQLAAVTELTAQEAQHPSSIEPFETLEAEKSEGMVEEIPLVPRQNKTVSKRKWLRFVLIGLILLIIFQILLVLKVLNFL